jgi:hypothetical protein
MAEQLLKERKAVELLVARVSLIEVYRFWEGSSLSLLCYSYILIPFPSRFLSNMPLSLLMLL